MIRIMSKNSNTNWLGQTKKYQPQVFFLLAICWVMGCTQDKKQAENSMDQYGGGETLFQSSGCMLCHSLKGDEMYGPPLNSIFNKQVTVYRNEQEQTLTVDKEYIFRSIQNPDYEKVKGYESRKMPLPALDDEQIDALTEYLIFINTN